MTLNLTDGPFFFKTSGFAISQNVYLEFHLEELNFIVYDPYLKTLINKN